MSASVSAPVVVVANATAGGGKAGKLIGKVDDRLRALRVDHQILVAESPADMEATARAAAEAGADVVAVLGGDGTASCAVNGVIGTGRPWRRSRRHRGRLREGDRGGAVRAGPAAPREPEDPAHRRGARHGGRGAPPLRQHRGRRIRFRGERDGQRDERPAGRHGYRCRGVDQNALALHAGALRAAG